MAYLDYNATTPLDERVLAEMMPFMQLNYGNPSSLYRQGRIARQAIEQAREQVAALVSVPASQVIFTSGGSEANNLALKGIVVEGERIAVSAIEHASVLDVARQVAGTNMDVIAVDDNGRLDQEALGSALQNMPKLVSLMLANNETGVLQDVISFANEIKAAGAFLHTDAVQAAGKVDLDFDALGVDLMTLSSHKIYGPKGAGALIVERKVALSPLICGGGQERGMRAGTENVAAIVGFGAAAELAVQEWRVRSEHTQALREYLEARLALIGEITIFALGAERLPNTVFFALPGIDAETLLMKLDKAGLDVSGGAACGSSKHLPSHVLLAMGVEESLARCAIRVSFGCGNTRADVDLLVDQLDMQAEQLRAVRSLCWA